MIRKMGKYSFNVTADTVARLAIGDMMIENGQKLELVAGAHSLKLEYCCCNDGAVNAVD